MDSRESLQLGDEIVRALAEFPPHEVRHALPFLMLQTGRDPASLPPRMRQLMADFAKAAGLLEETTPEGVARAIARYYDAHPVLPAILAKTESLVSRAHSRSETKRSAIARAFDRKFGSGAAPIAPARPAKGQSLLALLAAR